MGKTVKKIFKVLGEFIYIVVLYLATFGFMISAGIVVISLYARDFLYRLIGKRKRNG